MIGTTPYMSPEQARGAEVTRRSDVWAFGAILFEMLTGKRAFTGPTTSDVLAAILQGTPDWSALPPATPPAIARLVRRCLEREPKARLHDIGDARLEIEDAERALRGEHPADAQAAAPRPARATSVAPQRPRMGGDDRRRDAGAGRLPLLPRREDPRQEVRLQLSPPTGMRFVSVPAVSPDGRQMVFAAVPDAGGAARLWLRPLAAAAATELPGTEGASLSVLVGGQPLRRILRGWPTETRGHRRRQPRHRLRRVRGPRRAVARRRHDCVRADGVSRR